MSELLGWIGSICFALCGVPQVIKCIQQGHARGLAPLFLSLWLAGEICYVAAVLMKFGWVPWMMTNYALNITWVLVILRYKFWPRKASNE